MHLYIKYYKTKLLHTLGILQNNTYYKCNMCYNIYESEPFIGYPQFTRSLIDMSATEHEEMWIDKLFFSRHAALMCGECKRQCSITLRYK